MGFSQKRAERVPVPADEIAKYWRMYRTVPFVRASFNQFRDDVMAPGYRWKADNESTADYLEEWGRSGGTVTAERNRDMEAVLREIPVQLKARGTVLLEKNPAEGNGDMTAGLSFINPASITPYRASDTDLLLRPDDTQYKDAKLTEDGRAAAYVQFDNVHDPGDPQERRLALDDVIRITNDTDPHSVFGTSDVAPVAQRIESVREKLKDTDRAVSSMGWGQWFVGFGHETVANQDGSETIVEWEEGDMDDFMADLEGVEPGDIEGHDGTIDIQNLPGEIPDIIDQLRYETHYILTAMPAPTYSIGFESDINQFVVEGQQERHEQRIQAFRSKIERSLRQFAERLANEGGRNPSGAMLKLEPPEEDSPILKLSDTEVEKINTFSQAFQRMAASGSRTLLPDDVIREDILQFPPEVADGDGFEPSGLDMEGLADAVGDGEESVDSADGADSVESSDGGDGDGGVGE